MNLTSKIDACKALIDHPNTPDAEREAACRLLVRLQARAHRDGHTSGTAPGHRGPGRRAYGAKYTGYIPSAELTKLIRADIAILRKLGRQPARPGEVKVPEPIGDAPASIRFSVKKEDYTFSRSITITITITGVPADWWIDREDSYDSTMKWRKAGPQLTALKEALQEITWAYNYDGSDLTTDYHDRNFSDWYRADGHGESDHPHDI
ncbi:hypothetical protein AB0392_34115 [Nonomuraea angiospora]|uniref:hypothetical protein n=1 Tax=Nonomuraea angiospora TaxID=46172 RepID=UPI00344BD302